MRNFGNSQTELLVHMGVRSMVGTLGRKPSVDRLSHRGVVARIGQASAGGHFFVPHLKFFASARQFGEAWHVLAVNLGRIGEVSVSETLCLHRQMRLNQGNLLGVALVVGSDGLDSAAWRVIEEMLGARQIEWHHGRAGAGHFILPRHLWSRLFRKSDRYAD